MNTIPPVKPFLFASLALAVFAAGPAAASASEPGAGKSLFTCRDRAGRVFTSDRPIPECADRSMRELGTSGIVKREIAAPLTAEQQRQQEADERARRMAEEAVREKRRRDSALLAAYTSEDQIEQARKRNLADIEESIKRSQLRLSELDREKDALAQEAEFYRKKPMPPLVRRKVDDNVAAINDEETALRQRQGDVERINQRYDDERRRYRELTLARSK